MPIDQIISHIASTTLEKQQVAQTSDSQTGAENTSAEASRRSSTSTQNTDTLTPTNIPSDPTDNQETVVSAETVVEAHNIQDDTSNSAFKSYKNTTIQAQMQISDAGSVNEMSTSKESQEQQDVMDVKESDVIKDTNALDVSAEVSTLTVPAPTRKVSRFLVSPVVEQKNIAAEEEASSVTNACVEGADRANVATSQQPVLSTTNAEFALKSDDHVEMNVSEAQQIATMREKPSGNEIVQAVPYAVPVEQTDSTQQILQQGQQPIGLQQNIIQVQTVQQITGHVQQTTIGQSNQQHTIIVQGATITSQQIPQTSVQQFVPVNQQKEIHAQPIHMNGIAQLQTQYSNQAIVQSGVVMQQSQQAIPVQQSGMHMQAMAEHQHHSQMQAQRPPTVQQFVPQQMQPPMQQYVMLSGPMQQQLQPNIADDRNRRVSNISTTSSVSVDSQMSESSSIPEEKKQGAATATNVPVMHVQHVQSLPHDVPSTMQGVEAAQQVQTAHQNVHVPPAVAPPVSAPISVHPVVVTDVSASKVTVKTKEVSSTLPDLAQNLANILSNPKSKSVTPHPLTNHESTAAPVVAASTMTEYRPIQSEQYFQPIQPEVSQMQPCVQQTYQGQIVQGYQGQQTFQQTFQNQQLLHQNQTPLPQSIPLTIPQQIADVQSQMAQSTLQSVSSGQTQGKWIVSFNQIPLQQPIRHIQPNQSQPLQNQLQQIPMQLQMQPQITQDQQHGESSVTFDQSHLYLKLPEQHPVKPLEIESLESSNLN